MNKKYMSHWQVIEQEMAYCKATKILVDTEESIYMLRSSHRVRNTSMTVEFTAEIINTQLKWKTAQHLA